MPILAASTASTYVLCTSHENCGSPNEGNSGTGLQRCTGGSSRSQTRRVGPAVVVPGIVYPKVPPKVPSATLDLIRKHMSTPARTIPKGWNASRGNRGPNNKQKQKPTGSPQSWPDGSAPVPAQSGSHYSYVSHGVRGVCFPVMNSVVTWSVARTSTDGTQ